jgi:hypothetical protein
MESGAAEYTLPACHGDGRFVQYGRATSVVSWTVDILPV